jgi:hypothetical protein
MWPQSRATRGANHLSLYWINSVSFSCAPGKAEIGRAVLAISGSVVSSEDLFRLPMLGDGGAGLEGPGTAFAGVESSEGDRRASGPVCPISKTCSTSKRLFAGVCSMSAALAGGEELGKVRGKLVCIVMLGPQRWAWKKDMASREQDCMCVMS